MFYVLQMLQLYARYVLHPYVLYVLQLLNPFILCVTGVTPYVTGLSPYVLCVTGVAPRSVSTGVQRYENSQILREVYTVPLPQS